MIHCDTGIKVLWWRTSRKIAPIHDETFPGELYFVKLYSMLFMIQPSSKHGWRKALRYTI